MNNINGIIKKANSMIDEYANGKALDTSCFIELIKRINLMPNCKEKAMEIGFIASYLNILIDIGLLTNEEANKLLSQVNEIELYSQHVFSESSKELSAYLESAYYLNPMYKDILSYANNYPTFHGYVPKISLKKAIDFAKDFMYDFNPDLLYLYDKHFYDGLFFEVNLEHETGRTHQLMSDYSGIIIHHDIPNISKVYAIIHEMGHVYYNYLCQYYSKLSHNNIAYECMPKILEQLFTLFLRNNHLMSESDIAQYERASMVHQLRLMNSVYIVNKLLIDEQVNATYYAKDLKSDLPFQNYYDLSIIKPKDDSYMQFLDFKKNNYGFAFLFSKVVSANYIDDPEETKKFINEIPSNVYEFDSVDFINLFDKNAYLNATKKDISKVLSRTIYKK